MGCCAARDYEKDPGNKNIKRIRHQGNIRHENREQFSKNTSQFQAKDELNIQKNTKIQKSNLMNQENFFF